MAPNRTALATNAAPSAAIGAVASVTGGARAVPACQKLGFPSHGSLKRNYDSSWIRWAFGKFMAPSNLQERNSLAYCEACREGTACHTQRRPDAS
jgi:hypothetical protein